MARGSTACRSTIRRFWRSCSSNGGLVSPIRLNIRGPERRKGAFAPCSPAPGSRRSVPVLLDPGRSQARKSIFVDRRLPGQKFFRCKLVTLASLFEAEQTTPHGSDDFRLAAYHPAARIRGRQIGNRKWAAVRPDDIFDTRPNEIGHTTLYATQSTNPVHTTVTALKKA